MKTYLAIDVGASGGRHILGYLENGKLCLKEVYRFTNGMSMKNGHFCWDTDALSEHIIKGLEAARESSPLSVGIDTWGVDYVLLDEKDQLIGDAVAYRDDRTQGMDLKLEKNMSLETLYAHTGIARQSFNTVYQLMSVPPEQLQAAKTFLMMPDFLNFVLCGWKANEYTEASTTALLNAETRTWDKEVLQAAGIPAHIFSALLLRPGCGLGPLRDSVRERVGFDTTVVLPATHDTGSAFMAVPAKNRDAVYLSSGTWSLLGFESRTAMTGPAFLEAGFTNEGGYENTYRFLKNITGMWILQCIRKEQQEKYPFARMAEMAEEAKAFPARFDANAARFLAPENMIDEIRADLQEHGQALPQTDAELYSCVVHSLADCYALAIRDLEKLTGKHFTSINIVGGGSQNVVLNQWTAEATALPVYAGPTEGTALGNIVAQMIRSGEIETLSAARALIAASFDVKLFKPN